MPLSLPDFGGRDCLELDLCAHLADNQTLPANVAPVGEPQKAHYDRSGVNVFLGLVLPFPRSDLEDDEEDVHLHLRLTQASKFGDQLPQPNTTIESIIRAVEPFLGRRVHVNVTGVFRVQQAEMSPFIRSMFAEVQVGAVQVRMTGGTISVRGGPIQEIKWKLLGRAGVVEVDVRAITESLFDETYLSRALDLIEVAFAAFVVGEGTDASESGSGT